MWGRRSSTDGHIVYAVGDVHGRADLLEMLLARIANDAAGPAPGPVTVIFLGDYVDRGPASRAVLERLSTLTAGAANLRFLKGNHEATMLRFLQEPGVGPQWCAFGGAETLASYGVPAPRPTAAEAEWAQAQQELKIALPPHHLEFLSRLELIVHVGDYAFVHAGVRPGQPFHAQAEEDLLWIREDFLADRRKLEKIVVHGHTPERDPVRDHRRIGVDTGAYMTGVLTAVRIEDENIRFIATP